MKDYFLSIFLSSVLCSVISILAPKGGLSKQIQLILSLAIVCIIISPLAQVLQYTVHFDSTSIFDIEENQYLYEKQAQDDFENLSKEYLSQAIENYLIENFQVSRGDVRVHLEWEETEEEPTLSRILLILSGKAVWQDPAPMEEALSNLFSCTCESAIE